MEFPVGSVIKYKNSYYKVIKIAPSIKCTNCVFNTFSLDPNTFLCHGLNCTKLGRKDNQNVNFIKVNKLEAMKAFLCQEYFHESLKKYHAPNYLFD